jgi:CRP-like cAMP-binding protein
MSASLAPPPVSEHKPCMQLQALACDETPQPCPANDSVPSSALSTSRPPPVKLPNLDLTALLQRLPMFNGMSAEEIADIAQGARQVSASRGDLLFHRGDPCVGLHLLVSGQVKLFVTAPNGNEKVVELVSPGQTFGEALMFMDKAYVVTGQALMDSLLIHVAKAPIFAALEKNPLLCRKMIAGLSSRLHKLVADVESYSLLSGRDRIIGYLLRDLVDSEEPEEAFAGKTITVTLPTNKGIIASRLNLTQEHFSRILHELVESQLIRVEGRQIHILDLNKLRSQKP